MNNSELQTTSFSDNNKDLSNEKSSEQRAKEDLDKRLDSYGSESHYTKKKNTKKRDPNKPKIPKKIKESYLHNAGLGYLQRFATSSSHFKTVMMRKIDRSLAHHKEPSREECETMLNALVIKFQDLGLLNDQSYIRGVVTSCRRRGLSKMAIIKKLSQKGIGQTDIIQAVNDHDESEYDQEGNGDFYAALLFIKKKKLGVFDIEQKKDYQKSLAAMARAGFSYGIADKILNLDAEEIEQEYSSIL